MTILGLSPEEELCELKRSYLHVKGGRAYPVSSLCGLLGVSKQAYYKRDETVLMRRFMDEEMIADYVRDVRQSDPGIGGVKLWRMYVEETGRHVGRDAFCSVIAGNGLRLRQKPRRPRTTDSRHSLPVYPNLVRNFIPSAPNREYVSLLMSTGMMTLAQAEKCDGELRKMWHSYREEAIKKLKPKNVIRKAKLIFSNGGH